MPLGRSFHTAAPRCLVDKSLTTLLDNVAKKKGSTRGRVPNFLNKAPDRVEIVSEKLCDDVIQYLAPTLEQHKGCTLIDVHPGASLWSRKLHDFLKPKRHILMEPDTQYMEPFIKPLLDLPGSTYRHTPLVGAHPRAYIANYERVFRDAHLVEQPIPRLPTDDPRRRQLNPNILVTGNLVRAYKHFYNRKNVADYHDMIIQHTTYAALANEMMHRNGLVRMLWWLPEISMEHYHTFTIKYRRAFAASVSMGANVDCVVGSRSIRETHESLHSKAGDKLYRSRALGLEPLKEKEIEYKMDRAGMTVPKDRGTVSYVDAAEAQVGLQVLYQSPLEIKFTTIKALEEECAKEEQRLDHITKRYGSKAWSKRNTPVESLPKLDELVASMRFPEALVVTKPNAEVQGMNAVKTSIMVDSMLCAIRLEANFKHLEEASGQGDEFHPELRARLLAHSRQMETASAGGIEHKRFSDLVHSFVEDWVAYFLDPPILLRDRRTYATLKSSVEDFRPKYPMSLLDVTPNPREISVPGIADASEAAKVLQELVKNIFAVRASPLTESLDRIAPNMAKDLIPTVPALHDARKGGRLDPKLVMTRCVTDEMLQGLLTSFIEWPFRPQNWQLALAAGEAAPEESAEEEEGAEEE